MKFLFIVLLAGCFYVQAGYLPFDDDDDDDNQAFDDSVWRNSQQSQPSVDSIVTDIPDVPMDGEEDEGTRPPPLSLPAYQWVPASAVNKKLFAPGRGSHPVPLVVKALLLPSPEPVVTAGVLEPIELLCRFDQMSVRVRRDLFGVEDAEQSLRLGTCPVNKVTAVYYYFFYDLQSCGVKMKSLPDSVVYSNSLCYTPPSAGLVVREPSFTIPLECRYYRFYNSYKIGFQPCPKKGSLFRGLVTSGVSLFAMDARWKKLKWGDRYMLGKPMHFEVKIPSESGNKRPYVNKCYITASQHPNDTLQYTVVKNSGCMVDSMKTPQSRFILHSKKNVLRFTIGSFLFTEMLSKPKMTPKTLFLHCEVIVGGPRATPAAKSCTYNTTTETWQELFGNDAACICCASRCPAPRRPATRKMTSSRLLVEYDKRNMPTVPVKSGHKSSRPPHKVFEDIWDFSE